MKKTNKLECVLQSHRVLLCNSIAPQIADFVWNSLISVSIVILCQQFDSDWEPMLNIASNLSQNAGCFFHPTESYNTKIATNRAIVWIIHIDIAHLHPRIWLNVSESLRALRAICVICGKLYVVRWLSIASCQHISVKCVTSHYQCSFVLFFVSIMHAILMSLMARRVYTRIFS